MKKTLLLATLALLSSACDKPLSWGDWNAIIVPAADAEWPEIEALIDGALETRIMTVRPEKTFRVSQVDPTDADWGRLQRFRQILVVGPASDELVAMALEAHEGAVPAAPALLQVQDVWARGQSVTIVLTETESKASGIQAVATQLHTLLDGQYRQFVEERMFMSGRDSALVDTLWTEARFSMLLPEVYERAVYEDSVYIFRNENPHPSELIRQVTVAWRTPVPMQVERQDILDWRMELSDRFYSYPQAIDTSFQDQRRRTLSDMTIDEYQAIWSNPPEDDFPAGGPFVVRWIECPTQDRLYMIDAWLYAPAKDKYEYMLQLETIMDSFRCAGGGGMGS